MRFIPLRGWVLCAAAFFVMGCVSQRPIVGRDIPAGRARDIVAQQTTQQEVVEWFGLPDSLLQFPDGSQEYRYSYTGWLDRKVNMLLYSRTTTEKEYKNLSIRLQDGIVTRVTFTNTAKPKDNFSR